MSGLNDILTSLVTVVGYLVFNLILGVVAYHVAYTITVGLMRLMGWV